METKLTVWAPKQFKKKDIAHAIRDYGVGVVEVEYEPNELATVPWEVTITVKKATQTRRVPAGRTSTLLVKEQR